jgi:hypothetical protein
MPGARCTRGLVCHDAERKAHTSIQRKHHSLRNGFTAYFVLLCPPLERTCCHRHPEKLASQGLNASIAASGSHDLAVRFGVSSGILAQG